MLINDIFNSNLLLIPQINSKLTKLLKKTP